MKTETSGLLSNRYWEPLAARNEQRRYDERITTMNKKSTLTTLIVLLCYFVSYGNVYYTSPTGTETVLSKVSRENPADWRAITQGEMAKQLQCGDSVLLRWDQGIYTEGTRIYASGCSDTYTGAIHYLSEPGGFAVFKINKFPQNNPNHIDRFRNPNGITIGGEWYWKSGDKSDPINGWNKKNPDQSTYGRYVWVREIVMQGNFGNNYPKRDLGSLTMPYGSTGKKDPGTIAGSQNYDDMTGLISIGAYGSRIVNCVLWNLGHSGIGVNSGLTQGNATFYGNVITNTGHSGPEKDRFHSVYQQWRSNNQGRLIHKHEIIQFSAEEQLQIWAQSGIDPNTGESKVDRVDLIENVLINGGTLSGKNHPYRYASNSKIGGYTYDTDIRLIGNISWHDQGNASWQSGYSLNGNNERRNFYFKDNYLVGSGAVFKNVQSIREVSNNTFVSLGSRQITFDVNIYKENEMKADASNWNNNSYYGGGNFYYGRWEHDQSMLSNDKLSFSVWQNKGFDGSSDYSSDLPGDMIKYFANEYLEYYDTDWLGHVVVMNFSGENTKSIDVSNFNLNEGDKFRIIDVQNIAGDLKSNYVYEGVYGDGTSFINVNMVDHHEGNVVKDPTGEMVNPKGTDKRFGTFLIVRVERAAPNELPVADAGEDLKITLPTNTVMLDGSESADPDGTIVSYSCEKLSGPDNYKIEDGNSSTPTVTDLSLGAYTFKLTVTDNKGEQDSDEVKVTVEAPLIENEKPIADAGGDKNLTLPDNAVMLDGSDSHDKDGDIVAFAWEKISGADVSIEGSTTSQLSLSNLVEGAYEFKLTVTDDHGDSDHDIVELNVSPMPVVQEVVSFTLIDADANAPIADYDPIPEGATINLHDLHTTNLNIRANTDPFQVGSVKFTYGGLDNFKTENLAPYALHSDNGGNYNAWTPNVGDYTVTATPYDASYGKGVEGVALTLNFSIIDEAPVEEEEPTEEEEEPTEEEEEEETPEEQEPEEGQEDETNPDDGPASDAQAVISFTLINADTDQPIAAYDPIPEGAAINLFELSTKNLNIRANTDPHDVGSVMFSYAGQDNFKTENLAPYALYSDNGGNYNPWTPQLGAHAVTATPYSEAYRKGDKGEALTLNFTVIDEAPIVEEEPTDEEEPSDDDEEEDEDEDDNTSDTQKVVSFTLINAETDQAIAAYDPIPEGAEINLYDLPTKHLNIRANTDPYQVGSVMFSYAGLDNFKTENIAPYALYSDNSGDYKNWTPSIGSHEVTATPYSESYRKGEKGDGLTLNFYVINEAPDTEPEEEEEEPEVTDGPRVISFTLINADTNEPIEGYDPIQEGMSINLQALPTTNLNIRANTDPYEVGSVRFGLNGIDNYRTENKAPYALESDNHGNYKAWTPALGIHVVTATTYSEAYAKGEAGLPATLSFVVESYIPTAGKASGGIKYSIYPNPNKGVFDFEPLDKSIKIHSVAIYDSFGNKVYEKDYNKYFDVEHFALGLVKSGLYKIIVTTEKSIDYERMIIEF